MMKPCAAILVGLATGALLLGACGGGEICRRKSFRRITFIRVLI